MISPVVRRCKRRAIRSYYSLYKVLTNVRLDDETERLLARMARRHGISRSQLVRRGLDLLADEKRTE